MRDCFVAPLLAMTLGGYRGNTSFGCGPRMGMKVLHVSVIASDQRERGNPTVLVLKNSGIASGDCVGLAMTALGTFERMTPQLMRVY